MHKRKGFYKKVNEVHEYEYENYIIVLIRIILNI
jgi:hypothetical protein